MKKLAVLTVTFALFSFPFLAVSNADIVAENATLQKLAGNFQFTEGPNPDRDGNVYFTDQPNDRIMLWHTDGRLTTFMQPCGRSNGLYFSKKGTILACADELNQLWSIDTHGNKTVILKDLDGKLFNGPNDLWERPDGGIYFTDPLYKRPYWKRNPDMQMDGQHVYFLFPDYKKLIRVTDDLEQPNGIIGTADGKTLYVADIRARKTYSYSVNENGTLSDKKLFCELGSDGMTIDQEGNVYLTGKGVTVFNKAGEQIKHIDVPENWTANVCFGGKDNNLLFITASKSVYGILMNVKGGQ
jgi:gluconolactonase